MLSGILAALSAGIVWGLVFVTPLILPDYAGIQLSFGRYLAFGLIALLPAWLDRPQMRKLTRADWLCAFRLALVGNLIYYAALASAIQLAGAPLPTLIIGTLPVVIAICAKLFATEGDHHIAWRHLVLPLGLIASGLALVNSAELAQLHPGQWRSYWQGALLACIALAAWTWYPLQNSRYLQQHPHISASTWASAQGLATLPLAAAGMLIYVLLQDSSLPIYARLTEPEPLRYLGLMLVLGFFASWLGTLLWNYASQQLPRGLSGQLIVFETLAALTYAYCWRQEWPAPAILLGIALLVLGIMAALKRFQS